MAEMTELSKLAVDYLFGDRTVWKDDAELAATVREVNDKVSALLDADSEA